MITHLFCLLKPQQAILNRLLFEQCDVNSRTIIRDFNVHLSAFVIGAKGQSPLRLLARAGSDFRRFDAVVARVADQVHQRILDGFDDGPVKFCFRSLHPN